MSENLSRRDMMVAGGLGLSLVAVGATASEAQQGEQKKSQSGSGPKKLFGGYNCRVQFRNDFPNVSQYPIIGAIYAKFTYANGQESVSQKSVSIQPGNADYVYSRFSDDPKVECVKHIYAVMSWFYEDGSAHSGNGSLDAPSGQCTISATMRLEIPSFVPEDSKYSHPNEQILFTDPKSGKERVVWTPASDAKEKPTEERQMLQKALEKRLKDEM